MKSGVFQGRCRSDKQLLRLDKLVSRRDIDYELDIGIVSVCLINSAGRQLILGRQPTLNCSIYLTAVVRCEHEEPAGLESLECRGVKVTEVHDEIVGNVWAK